MSVITLTERGRSADGVFDAAVRFEGGGEHAIKVEDPLAADPDGERLLAWYFEEHLRYPHLDRDQKRAAVALLADYGVKLFEQVFCTNEGSSFEFKRIRAGGFDDLELEIIGGSNFHRLHWEALRENGSGTPFGVRVPIMRRVEDVDVGFDVAAQGPVLNVLVVTARPNGARDVGYRTISRPLLKALRKASIPVSVDLVRPGSWRALKKHLQAVTAQKGSGWYRIVHFDVHGAVTRTDELQTNRADEYLLDSEIPTEDEHDAYLFFEAAKAGGADPVPTVEVADLLVEHRVPVAVLNACQSAMQSEGSEASLAQRLVEAGVPISVGMAYSVTVSAAELMMPVIYEQLASGVGILPAIHAGRRELFDTPARHAYFDQELDLEDWVLPVVFSQWPVDIQPQRLAAEQEEEIYTQRSWRVEEPPTEYGFVGRDLDVQAIERHLLGEAAHNELLISGMAGAGKSTLLGHLAWWWQETGLISRVFSFSYENRAWTVDQILQTIVTDLLDGREQVIAQNLPEDALLERVTTLLRANRHLLVIDNAESITATPASIPHSLPESERTRLRKFLARLRGGKTLVLIGSRGGEKWLAEDAFGSNVYELRGLDPQATSILLERIITRHGGHLPDSDSERNAMEELVSILGGYPLALTVVLPAIASTPPSTVLSELKKGGEVADPAKIIQRAVEYSHGRLDPTTQNSLIVLAPFTGVVPKVGIEPYRELLEQHPSVAALGALDLEAAIDQAIGVGLAAPDTKSPNHIRLQPLFPYFLRTRIYANPDLAAAVTRAHHDLYQQLGPSLHSLLVSHEPNERAAGMALTRAEYANLTSALEYALKIGTPLPPLVVPLEEYLDQAHQENARQQLLEKVIDGIGHPCPVDRRGELAAMHNLAGVAALARHQLNDARAHHEAELALQKEGLKNRPETAITYHQLGIVAQEQRRFDEAKTHYEEALKIKLEFNDRHSAASTYHQLGILAQKQGDLREAEAHYNEALELFIEFDDRLNAAVIEHQLGLVAQEQAHFEEAEDHYTKALRVKLEFNDRHNAASTYYQLGRVAQEQGRFEENDFRKALEIFEELGDRFETADIYYQLGRVTMEHGRFEEAETHFKKALKIFEEFEDPPRAAGCMRRLGELLISLGRIGEAIRYSLVALLIGFEFTAEWSIPELHALKWQRKLIGEDDFRLEVVSCADQDVFDRLTQLIDRLDDLPESDSA